MSTEKKEQVEKQAVITVFTDEKNRLTKEILNKDLDKAASGHVWKGSYSTMAANAEGLSDIIKGLKQTQCLCNGISGIGLVDDAPINDKFRRNGSNFTFSDAESWMLLDFDFPSGESVTPEKAIELLSKYDPTLKDCMKVVSYSSSSWLYDVESDEKLNATDNFHIYIGFTKGTDITPYCTALFKRLVNDGYGYIMVVKKSGSMKVKTLIDETIWNGAGGSREIFEAPPVCCEGVESRKQNEALFMEGPLIEWKPELELTQEDFTLFAETVHELKSDPVAVKESLKQKKIGAELRKNRKKQNGKGHRISKKRPVKTGFNCETQFLGLSEWIKDPDGNDIAIQDLIADINKWKDKGFPDPIDPYKRGSEALGQVGKGIAYIRQNEATGEVYIFSFWGDVEYHFVWDVDAVEAKMENISLQDFDEFCESFGYGDYTYDFDDDEDLAVDLITKKAKELQNTQFGSDGRSIRGKVKKLFTQIVTEKGDTERNGKEFVDLSKGSHAELTIDYTAKIPQRIGPHPVYTQGKLYTYNVEEGVFEPSTSEAIESDVGECYLSGYSNCKVESHYRAIARMSCYRIADEDFFGEGNYGVPGATKFIRLTETGDQITEEYSHELRQLYKLKADPKPIRDILREFTIEAFNNNRVKNWDEPNQLKPESCSWLDAVILSRSKLLKSYIDSTFMDDPEEVVVVQEATGATISGLLSVAQKSIMPKGDGENGKSVLLELLENSVPAPVRCSVTPHQLGSEYYRAMLAGCILNTVGEVDHTTPMPATEFKNITGNDTISGRDPFGKPINFKSICGHWFALNDFPITKDHSHGFYRRIQFINFKNKVKPENKIPNLGQKIADSELDVFLTWALAGATRFVKNGYRFTKTTSHDELMGRWKSVVDSVAAFLTDECIIQGDAQIDRPLCYVAYTNYCEESHIVPYGRNKFYESVGKKGFTTSKKSGGSTQFRGFKLKSIIK